MKCPPGSTYHDDIHHCVKLQPVEEKAPKAVTPSQPPKADSTGSDGNLLSNLNSSKWISTANKPSAIYLKIKERRSKDPHTKICPISKPFVSSGKCTTCPAREYFNFDTELCESCPRGTVFNVNTHTCLESIGTGVHQTNPNSAPNLVLGGISIAQYESTYNSNKATYSDITDCPPDQPYFDNTNCVSCS